MKRIILTEEQAKLLSDVEAVEICDPQGRLVAALPPILSAEDRAAIRRARKRSGGPNIPGEMVQKGLLALEEAWAREGPFDVERALEIMRQAREQ